MNKLVTSQLATTLLDDFPSLIAALDTDYNICWANKANLAELGLTLEKIIDCKCYILKGYSKPCSNCPITEVYRTKKYSQSEVLQSEDKSPLEDNNTWVIEASPIKDFNGSVIGVLKLPVTSPAVYKLENKQKFKKKSFVK